jgi:hypothetical protein
VWNRDPWWACDTAAVGVVGGLAVDAAGFSGHSDRDVVANGR